MMYAKLVDIKMDIKENLPAFFRIFVLYIIM